MKVFIQLLLVVFLFAGFTSCNEANKENEKQDSKEGNFTRTDNSPTFYKSHEAKKQEAPFSDIVKVGDTYYLAGQIGMDHGTRTLVDETIEGQTKQTLENIKQVLAQHKLEMKDVVKATVILDHIEDFQAFNKIYEQYFPQKPARTTFAAEALAAGALIEIEVVAVAQ